MTPGAEATRRRFFDLLVRGLPWLTFGWLLIALTVVYLVGDGQRPHRVESACWLALISLVPWLTRLPSGVVPAAESQWARLTLGVGLVAAIGFWLVAVGFSFGLPFLSDDYVFLHWAHVSGDALRASGFFRPVFSVIFLALSRVSDTPLPFHALSAVLHVANTGLAFALARRILKRQDAAMLAAGLFLVNPIQLEAVAWISGLQELLWTFFILLGVWLYTRPSFELSTSHTLVVAAVTLLGLLSKETAICFVALFVLADISLKRARHPVVLRGYVVLGGMAAVYLLVRARFAVIDEGFFFWPSQYFLKELFARPYRVFTQPWNGAAVAVPDAVVWISAVALAVFVFAAIKRGDRRLLIGPAVVLISTAPLGGYFFVAPDLSASRYLYFAWLGWALLIADCASRVWATPAAFRAGSIALIAVSAITLHLNGRPWRAAGQLVEMMRQAVIANRDVEPEIEAWRRVHVGRLDLEDGIPTQYDGVDVFLNGYREFVDWSRRAPPFDGLPPTSESTGVSPDTMRIGP